MLRYDVIVCGAGPAGASAAYAIAQAGLKVALLEKQSLPRHKTCGGGMPITMGHLLADLAPEAVVESEVRYMRHTWKFEDPAVAAINPPGSSQELTLWMVQRSQFDYALAQRAASAGADLRDGLAVRSVEPDQHGVTVRAQAVKATGELAKGDSFVATAAHVIGADGANGVTVSATNLRKNPTVAIGMEVEHPHEWGTGHPDLRQDVLHLDYGAVPKGYAWIFPKRDHLNVGAGIFGVNRRAKQTDQTIGVQLRQTICDYLASMQIAYDPEQMRFHAHPLPTWRGKEARHTPDGRILLVGDAAGLIGPLFGDGLLHAVKSGLIAASCLIDGAAQDYSNRIHAEFAANFDAALNLSRFFYQWPHFCYKYGVKQERATPIAARLLGGDLSFQEMGDRAIRRVRQQMLGAGFNGMN